MPFGDRYLDSLAQKPRARKGLTLTLSLSFHAAAIVFAIFWGFFHVEELPPPPVTVTFFAAAAPPPPPPPPPPPKRSSVTKVHKDVVQPTTTPNQITQPKEQPKEEDDGEEGGVEGGVKGGVKGGVVGGTVGGVVGGQMGGSQDAPKLVPPSVASGQKQFSPDPQYTQAARASNLEGTVTAKICVNAGGAVSTVSLLRHMAMGMDDTVVNTVKTWKFKPFMFNGRPMPFCYVANFVFKLR